MQKLSGRGIAFLEIDGYAVEYDLAPGARLVVDTGLSRLHGCDLLGRGADRTGGEKYAVWRRGNF